MSYPQLLHVLIVEDDPRAVDDYQSMLASEKAVLCFAFCLEDAAKQLESDRPFHVVLVDLRIPLRPDEPAPEFADYGLGVVELCAQREAWPVPAVLVVSGHIEAKFQTTLETQLQENFYFGRARNKGDVSSDLRAACDAARHYVHVGLHQQGDAALSPREEDLLRRALLKRRLIGAELRSFSVGRDTKVYQLRAWDREYNILPAAFAKFLSSDGARYVIDPTTELEAKLPHIKVLGAETSGSRSLLMTQKAGYSSSDPASLEAFLMGEEGLVETHATPVALGIFRQLERLGNASPVQKQPRELLELAQMQVDGVPALERVRQQMMREDLGDGYVAVEHAFRMLLGVAEEIRVPMRTSHGDLNPGNVALEFEGGVPSAYIFDAGGLRRQPTVRDLATLEVGILLHLGPASDALVRSCEELFGVPTPPGVGFELNVRRFIAALRAEALREAPRNLDRIYRLCLFDVAFGQVWGLHFREGNKVRSTLAACRLLAIIAPWALGPWVSSQEDPGF